MKEFKVSSWSIDNKTSIYVLTVIITIAGILSYISLPKEQFPEVVFPQFYVSTVYPGASPKDIENTVTKHLEKQMKAIPGVKKVTSTSMQDYSNIIVEFNSDVDITDARQKVKDKVDEAKPDLPQDLPADPAVIEIDVSQIPIMNVNLSGDIDLMVLKKYAEDLQDRIEAMKEIRRVDIIGAPEREIQINVDKFKMEASGITMDNIAGAVAMENRTGSAGQIKMDNVKRTVSIPGEFTDVSQLNRVVLRSNTGTLVYLNEIAAIVDTVKEKESFARLGGENVITLNVVKRSGENLIDASDKIRLLTDELQKTKYPKNLKVTITGDQSTNTKVTLHDLINTIIIGFVLVTVILMFFMGATNAMFVAMSVPLSCFIAFLVFPSIGFELNMIVLFAFLLALGIVVDDAIVVIENTHRVFENGKVPIVQAAKQAAGEVFLPVFSGTATTLAPFIPLAFWPGVIGDFMFYLPITLIVTLVASLLVAYIINPVFAVDFMKPHHDHEAKDMKKFRRTSIIMAIVAGLCYLIFGFGMGNLIVLFYILYVIHFFVLESIIRKFQNHWWPGVQNSYEKVLRVALKGYRPVGLLLGTVGLFIFSFILIGITKPNVVFFPSSDPNFIFTYIELPIGTDQVYTDSIAKVVENRVFKVVGDSNDIVTSVITNVTVGAGDEMDMSVAPHKAKVTVAFVEFAKRHGKSTAVYLDSIRQAVKGIPGVKIRVEQEQGGPPTGKPINIEITGEDFQDIVLTSERLMNYIDTSGIEGIENLESDLVKTKPEIKVVIDREKAMREGISTVAIAQEIRKALFGAGMSTEGISKFRDNEDEYPIQLRFKYDQRNTIESLLDHRYIFMDMAMKGAMREVPLSSLVHIEYENTLGGIKRKNQKRVITLSSNVLSGYNANDINVELKKIAKDFNTPSGVSISFTGEQEDQEATANFLGGAMLTSILLIVLILVTQFNSISKPLIILSEIFFSIIGVLLGFSIFGMDISILMTGIGIVALAGIVVRNGILLIEFTVELRNKGYDIFEAAVVASKTRMTPVLLTATATMLGLVPLAVGLNIDFVTLFTELNPHIFFGGDSVAFWGPLSWTMIFGLAFATFLTLVLVPAMYIMVENFKVRINKRFKKADANVTL